MKTCGNILGTTAVALVLGVAVLGTGCASLDEQTSNSEQPVQDTWITSKVMTAFSTMEDTDNSDIGVETSNGVVTLTGRVESQDQLDILVATAARVEGVWAVQSDLVKVVED